jgi:hypothetical protein
MKHKIIMIIPILICSILVFGKDTEKLYKLMKLSIIVEKEGQEFADGPIYVDLVLTNNSSNDIKLLPYPRLAAREFPDFLGSGFVINLTDEAGKNFTFGKPLTVPNGGTTLWPPPWTLRSGEMWRWTLDIKSILTWNSEVYSEERGRRFKPGDYDLTISLADGSINQEITSAPVKISLVRESETATAQAEEQFRDTPRNRDWILKSDKFEKTELSNQVLPTFRRMVKSLGVIGKAQKGEYNSSILANLPSEDEWGIWADDIAAARYMKAVKTDKTKTKQIREETESKFPGSRWLLDQIDRDTPFFYWLSPKF